MISLAGKAALVTGGSRGIGAATVKMFAQAGADVVFSYHRNREAAAQLEQELKKHGTRVESFKADVGKMGDAQKLVDFAKERLGRLDILIANAGIYSPEEAPIEKLSEKEWDEMIRVNLKGIYAVTHYVAAQMIAQKSGRIVTVSSGAAQAGSPYRSHYSATKGAIISFTKSLAVELAPHNILVNCIAPGFIQTDMSEPFLKTKKGLKFATEISPMRRVGTVEEIAGPILFMVSDWATFMTGEVLNVNGGSVRCG
jgi:3-oxoacyl-[acyl-carrier protein] reductase